MTAGRKAKLYRNTATNASPTWVEILEARDVDITRAADQVEESDRGSDYKKYDDGQIELAITFNMTYRNGNANCDYLRDALLNGTAFEVAAMDGDVATSGSTGPRFFGKVFQVNKSEPLADGQTYDLEIRPTYHEESSAVVQPSEYTVP